MSRKTIPKTPCCYGLYLTVENTEGKIIKLICSTCRILMDTNKKVIEPLEIVRSGRFGVPTQEKEKELKSKNK